MTIPLVPPPPADPNLRAAGIRETAIRLALAGIGDRGGLLMILERWLTRKARLKGLDLPGDVGRHRAANDRAEINVDRDDQHLVIQVIERDDLVPARRWTTEIAARGSGVALDVRVTVDQPVEAPYAPRRTPVFVAHAIGDANVALRDVIPLSTVPAALTAADIDYVVELIANPGRQLPVLVISVPTVVDPGDLAERLAGAAHIFTINHEAALALTDRVGRYRSVFHGGVRTYPAGFRWIDPPHTAPLWLGARLAQINEGLPATERIVRLALARTALSLATRPLLTIGEVDRQARLRQDTIGPQVREDLAHLEQQLAAAGAARDALQARLDEQQIFWKELEADNQRLLEERQDAEDLAHSARNAEYRWRAERDALVAANDAPGLVLGDDAVAPIGPDEFVAFVDARYQGRIVVSPRARRFYRDSEYEHGAQLVHVLDAIATHYYDRERGVEGAHERWNAACEALYMKHGASATEMGADDDHRLRWNDQNLVMYHVRSKGKTYDPRRMLYVGFIFDPTTQQVVLGRLPSKPTTMADHT
ncbi:MAG: hypothetical protein JWM87_3756 [Candidatus Eremiobacteraeota bacterium]|nr:hypothetical protein [Candidatus Eremiobacteraeota bacterium]